MGFRKRLVQASLDANSLNEVNRQHLRKHHAQKLPSGGFLLGGNGPAPSIRKRHHHRIGLNHRLAGQRPACGEVGFVERGVGVQLDRAFIHLAHARRATADAAGVRRAQAGAVHRGEQEFAAVGFDEVRLAVEQHGERDSTGRLGRMPARR